MENYTGKHRKRIALEIESHLEEVEERIEDYGTNYNSWACLSNGRFIPSYPSVKLLPPGFYDVDWIDESRCIGLIKREMKLDELYQLPSPEITDIISDIKNFWTSKEKFREYHFVHKRGILLYGDPGCGKSGIIQLCTKYLIEEMGGIVINIKDGEAVEKYVDFIPDFRKIETERPIIVIMEDIDSIAGEDRHSTSKILNILDGMGQIDNVVYIATTNYPEKLEERITNRPSRFDRRYRVELPNPEIREAYFISKLKKQDIKKLNIKEWVEKTEGMSLAHLRELVISVIAMENDFQETIDRLNGMQVKPTNKLRGNMGFGK